MVDVFTQWIFRPLWDDIAEALRLFPTDGTFDQLKPVHRLNSLFPKRGRWSFDLSAATDRLPVLLQTQLLAPFITLNGARLWMTLLIGRGYKVYSKLYNLDTVVHYEVGQPMGALTS